MLPFYHRVIPAKAGIHSADAAYAPGGATLSLKGKGVPYSGSSKLRLMVSIGTSVLTDCTDGMRIRWSDWKRQ